SSTMDIPNIGQAMALGDLYNARTGHCTNGSVLSKALTPDLILSREEPAINTKFISEESYRDKFKAFEISGDLKLGILANLVPLNTQAKHLKAEKQSSKSVKISMSLAVQTKLERINIGSKEVQKCINMMALEDTEATHVVTGIQWGANMLCSFEHHLEEGEISKDVAGMLRVSCDALQVGVGAGGGVTRNKKSSNGDLSVQISILGDIVPKEDSYPTNVEDAVQLMKRVPTLLLGVNQGKGSVLQYKLEPIDKVRAYCEIATRVECVINNIDLDLVDKVESTFDVIVENRIRLSEAAKDILMYRNYIAEKEVNRINKEIKSFNRDELEFKNSLSKIVRDIQAGKADVDELAELLKEFEQGSCSSSMVDEAIESFQPLLRRISFIRRCQKVEVDVDVISREHLISDVLPTSVTDLTFIFIIPKSIDYTVIEQSDIWRAFRLLKEDEKGAQTKFMVHDASVSPNDPQTNGVTELAVFKYHGSTKSDQKVVRGSILYPSIKLSLTRSINQAERTQLSGHTLRVPCPFSHDGRCHSSALEWVCFKCEDVLQYEFNELVYCACGETKLEHCTFRCDSIEHGYQYERLHAKSIQSIREKQIPGDDEIVILLLGETGVGKSTFINAFANYLQYETLEIAERKKMRTLIQSSFVIEDTKVTVGEPDNNESLKDGQSSTQRCRSYVFRLNENTMIRLIDTPGVGDTRGVKQDRINFDGIMNYISEFEKINGVCLLLPPNTSRLTLSFQFCVDELLLHLHKSAARNILFTFTKTRSSFYRAGDTLTPLRKYLKELEEKNGVSIPLQPNNMFYFDNEAFRLCAALKQGILFTEETKAAYAGSWIQSVNEAQRLINENITVEVQAITQLKKDAEKTEMSAKDLESKLMCSYRDLDPINLEQPRTVCTSSSCTTVHDNIVRYNTHCHKDCLLEDVAINVVNHAGLRGCWAMNGGETCRVCGCPWQTHMHVKIDYTEVKKQRIDAMVEKEWKEKLSQADEKKLAISKVDERISALKLEKKLIFDSLMSFSGFLLQNSILVQNSGILAYIDMSIENQEKVAQRTKDDTIVKSIREQRAEYQAQKEMFENTIRNGRPATITLEEVIKAREALCRLKINGEALAKVLDIGQQHQNQVSVVNTRVVDGNVSKGWKSLSPFGTVKSIIKTLVLR
ncbi:hypothetical protein BGW38_003856, partial [Lunasporangiospora selenospora]